MVGRVDQLPASAPGSLGQGWQKRQWGLGVVFLVRDLMASRHSVVSQETEPEEPRV
jgi:hypothetical protein